MCKKTKQNKTKQKKLEEKVFIFRCETEWKCIFRNKEFQGRKCSLFVKTGKEFSGDFFFLKETFIFRKKFLLNILEKKKSLLLKKKESLLGYIPEFFFFSENESQNFFAILKLLKTIKNKKLVFRWNVFTKHFQRNVSGYTKKRKMFSSL